MGILDRLLEETSEEGSKYIAGATDPNEWAPGRYVHRKDAYILKLEGYHGGYWDAEIITSIGDNGIYDVGDNFSLAKSNSQNKLMDIAPKVLHIEDNWIYYMLGEVLWCVDDVLEKPYRSDFSDFREVEVEFKLGRSVEYIDPPVWLLKKLI